MSVFVFVHVRHVEGPINNEVMRYLHNVTKIVPLHSAEKKQTKHSHKTIVHSYKALKEST